MKPSEHDERTLRKAGETLARNVETLGPEVTRRLSRLRANAISRMQTKAPWWQQWYIPAGATASVCVLALVFSMLSRDFEITDYGDLEILSESEEMELYEDLEFYEWLPSVQHTG